MFDICQQHLVRTTETASTQLSMVTSILPINMMIPTPYGQFHSVYIYVLAILACNHIAITYRIYGDNVLW